MKLDILLALNEARRARRAAILVTDTATGEERLVAGDAVEKDPLAAELQKRLLSARSGMLEDGRTFLTVQVPPPRLVVIGAVHISQALAPMARLAGFDVTHHRPAHRLRDAGALSRRASFSPSGRRRC